ncbi:class I SAM-dependent methyltransferase [Flexivirga caeni]|uniref:class I SAM-dependent methyltransferase n=1 Tax=Flexivirga caeni TaxID=2294115 RepID=UPI0015E8B187|nr:class I SAM-dependent methyltransferase [Flexivirga caeni]
MRGERPVGAITRGTTSPNRLRRCDRWLLATQAARLRQAPAVPIVVDLGYGASPITAVELRDRVRRVRPDARVVGIEIDPERVAAAQPFTGNGLSFVRGGFELPVPGQVTVVRAFNVLRQYDESDVAGAWSRLQERLTPDGLVIDGTCDEIGRVMTWVALDRAGPVSLSLSLRLRGLNTPSIVAERLPKALIHRNVPGERIHAFLRAVDHAWAKAGPHASYGVRQRFVATATSLRADGWPLVDQPSRWRLGELSVAWEAVAPA